MNTLSTSRRGWLTILLTAFGIGAAAAPAKAAPRYLRTEYRELKDDDVVQEGDFWCYAWNDPNAQHKTEMHWAQKYFALGRNFKVKDIKGPGRFWRVVGVVEVY